MTRPLTTAQRALLARLAAREDGRLSLSRGLLNTTMPRTTVNALIARGLARRTGERQAPAVEITDAGRRIAAMAAEAS